MQNFFEKTIEKISPSFFKERRDLKAERNKRILKRYRQEGELTSRDEMHLLDMLNKRGMIPKTELNVKMERMIYVKSTIGIGVASLVAFSPYLIREFHQVSGTRQKFVVLSLFSAVAFAMIYPYYKKVRQHNSKLIKENIYKAYEQQKPEIQIPAHLIDFPKIPQPNKP